MLYKVRKEIVVERSGRVFIANQVWRPTRDKRLVHLSTLDKVLVIFIGGCWGDCVDDRQSDRYDVTRWFRLMSARWYVLATFCAYAY